LFPVARELAARKYLLVLLGRHHYNLGIGYKAELLTARKGNGCTAVYQQEDYLQ